MNRERNHRTSKARHLVVPAQKTGADATGASAVGAKAIGTLLTGALAFGALAVGAVAIGRLAIGRARIRRLEIDELVVGGPRTSEELRSLLAKIEPALNPGRFAFVTLPADYSGNVASIATIREPEGVSAILAEQDALDLGMPVAFTAAWITLTVQSDLAAVGLTAAFADALAKAGISCNVVAGVHHDHLFVPFERAQDAMDALRALQRSAQLNR